MLSIFQTPCTAISDSTEHSLYISPLCIVCFVQPCMDILYDLSWLMGKTVCAELEFVGVSGDLLHRKQTSSSHVLLNQKNALDFLGWVILMMINHGVVADFSCTKQCLDFTQIGMKKEWVVVQLEMQREGGQMSSCQTGLSLHQDYGNTSTLTF